MEEKTKRMNSMKSQFSERKSLEKVMSLKDYISLGLGTIVGIGWIIFAGIWLTRGGPLGAMLAFIFAAHFPGQVKKLLLVGSGPFEESYAENLMDVRLSRLQPGERDKALLLITILADGNPREKDNALHQLGGLFTRTDAYNPITLDTEVIEVKYRIYEKVWAQAQDLRATGQLLKMGKSISCPVVAIHGDYDPHPAAGIKIPLEKVLTHFKFIQLEHCGHLPWIEKEAREPFFNILAEELATT